MGLLEFLLTLLGVGIVIVVLLVGGWLHNVWIINLLRNHRDARRRLRRGGPPDRPGKSN